MRASCQALVAFSLHQQPFALRAWLLCLAVDQDVISQVVGRPSRTALRKNQELQSIGPGGVGDALGSASRQGPRLNVLGLTALTC